MVRTWSKHDLDMMSKTRHSREMSFTLIYQSLESLIYFHQDGTKVSQMSIEIQDTDRVTKGLALEVYPQRKVV